MPSVGSLSGTQLSILKACNIGEDGHEMGLEQEGTGVPGVTLDGGLRARSRRLTSENNAWDPDGLVGEGRGSDGRRRGLVGHDIGPHRSEDAPSKRESGGLRGRVDHPIGLWQALFQKRGLVGLDCGLSGGDNGVGLPGRERILSELSL